MFNEQCNALKGRFEREFILQFVAIIQQGYKGTKSCMMCDERGIVTLKNVESLYTPIDIIKEQSVAEARLATTFMAQNTNI